MRVMLEVDKGPNKGSRYELGLRSYRAVGRIRNEHVTVNVAQDGGHALDPDDLKVVEEHLERRRMGPRGGGVDTGIGSYKRGRDIHIEDDKISRNHAMLFFDEDGPSVVDLLSTNGTLVNGKKVGDADLHHGDILNIGKTRFIVRIEADSP